MAQRRTGKRSSRRPPSVGNRISQEGRESERRTVGLHRCKHAWCPACSRIREGQLAEAEEVDRLLILARNFGLEAGHARLATLTVPNGKCIHTLREQTHAVFCWVRGSEVVTGADGDRNLHDATFLVDVGEPAAKQGRPALGLGAEAGLESS